jgi:hypothetical protein
MRNFNLIQSKVIAVLVACLMVSCASTTKKKCSEENWTEFGRSLGSTGQHWENHPYLNECSSAGVQPDRQAIQTGYLAGLGTYCVPGAFETAGVAGEIRDANLCDAQLQKGLKEKYDLGLRRHCTKQGAFNRGRSGKMNLKVCPVASQGSYDQYYLRGRSAYFKIEIATKEQALRESDQRITLLDSELADLRHKQARYEYLIAKKNPSRSETLELAVSKNYMSEITEKATTREKTLQSRTVTLKEVDDLRSQKRQNDSFIVEESPNGALESGNE